MTQKTVAVLGASPNKERYSNKAVRLLIEKDFRVVPINPACPDIERVHAVKDVQSIREPIHTLSIYLGPDKLTSLIDQIIELNPQRVIFNPGTENPEVKNRLEESGIPCVEACTLVMLKTGQF